MSSHREAPAISQDPVADNADTYAFVSPDDPSTVTIITNYVPLEGPPGGPNFFEFGDDVLYSIYIDNDGDALPEIEYQFQFRTTLQNEDTFLYNTGPIGSLNDPNWNKRQLYSVSLVRGGGHDGGQHKLRDHLHAAMDAIGFLLGDLEVIVDEAKDAQVNDGEERKPDRAIGEPGPEQRRDHHGAEQ